MNSDEGTKAEAGSRCVKSGKQNISVKTLKNNKMVFVQIKYTTFVQSFIYLA